MASMILYRASAIIVIGVLAGAVHSMVYSKTKGPIVLRLKQDAPTQETPPKPSQTPEPIKNSAQPTNGSPATQPPPPSPPPPPAAPKKPDIHITLEQAKKYFDQQVPFIDARHIEDYEQGHVTNAFLMDSDAFLSGAGAEVLGFIDRDKPFVVYCSGGACDASENLVMLMQQGGYKEPFIMVDGFPGWQKAGYPTATGKPVVGGGGG